MFFEIKATRTLSMSTESSANHCLASFCCTTQATCRQAAEGKEQQQLDHVRAAKSDFTSITILNSTRWGLHRDKSYPRQSWREGTAGTDLSCTCRSLFAWCGEKKASEPIRYFLCAMNLIICPINSLLFDKCTQATLYQARGSSMSSCPISCTYCNSGL